MIAVVENTGGTNLNSVCHALNRLGAAFTVTGDPARIKSAEKVILPGVGAAAQAMARLRQEELIALITSLKQPVLGICLGMQLLFRRSEEGDTDCLNIIPADVRLMRSSTPTLRVPHMGWNQLIDFDRNYVLCRDLPEEPYLYFVHSYAAAVGSWVKASAQHGEKFPAIVQYNNFFGCQFHPEKSAKTGAIILRNFISMKDIP